MIGPSTFFWILLAITGVAWLLDHLIPLGRVRRMSRWAAEAKLFYSPVDRLGIAPRVARMLDFPGAANVRVFDLMYRSDGHFHYYLFTVEYSRGVMHRRTRVVQVAALDDPVGPAGCASDPALRSVAGGLPRLEQYRLLLADMPPA
jgi:hypothetical protein